MNRFLFIGVILVGFGAAYWFWQQDPAGRQGRAGPQVEVIEQAGTMPDSVAVPAPAVPASAQRAPTTAPPMAEVTPSSEAKEVPKGPFDINLGSHSILLKTPPGEQQRMVEVELHLVTPNYVTRREIINRREQLIRMMFFLGTRRSAKAAEGDAGRDLFANHLVERFRNVIKTGAISEIKLTTWEIHDWDPPKPDEK